MVNVVNIDPGTKSAEVVLQKGCHVCGSDIHLRLTPGDARTWCPTCHLGSRPKIVWRPGGMTLDFPERAKA